MSKPSADIQRDAVISDDGLYRYTLRRRFPVLLGHDQGAGFVNFILLNPSTADHATDDATVRVLMGYAGRWGYRELVVTNLFAYRATKPANMKRAADPIGPENDRYILIAATNAELVVCAWGTDGAHLGRSRDVLAKLAAAGVRPHALALTKGGHPHHPLRLSADLMPVPMIV